jgi:hypothetical protein
MEPKGKQDQPNGNGSTAVIVFGVDEHGKPKAARFADNLAALATKAASQMHLGVLTVGSADVEEIATRLPVGRIYANGRGFVPYVRRDLYDKLVTLANAPPRSRSNASPASSSNAAARSAPKGPMNEAGTGGNSAGSAGLPGNWDEIGPGHLVLAQETLRDGWWEAIVVERHDDMLTLRWRDYPRYQPFRCHVDGVALLRCSTDA